MEYSNLEDALIIRNSGAPAATQAQLINNELGIQRTSASVRSRWRTLRAYGLLPKRAYGLLPTEGTVGETGDSAFAAVEGTGGSAAVGGTGGSTFGDGIVVDQQYPIREWPLSGHYYPYPTPVPNKIEVRKDSIVIEGNFTEEQIESILKNALSVAKALREED